MNVFGQISQYLAAADLHQTFSAVSITLVAGIISWRHTCEVVEAVVLEDLVQDAEKLPHLGGDGLTGEAER